MLGIWGGNHGLAVLNAEEDRIGRREVRRPVGGSSVSGTGSGRTGEDTGFGDVQQGVFAKGGRSGRCQDEVLESAEIGQSVVVDTGDGVGTSGVGVDVGVERYADGRRIPCGMFEVGSGDVGFGISVGV